jgi:hypothetical protein
MKPEIIKNGSNLTILSFTCPRGIAPETTIDLSIHAGEYVRIWLDEDMTYSLDKHINHYWQVAELQVPMQKYQSVDIGEVDEQDLPITTSEPIPIKLPVIRLFDIEEKK